MNQTELNFRRLKEQPNYEFSYFDIKTAVDQLSNKQADVTETIQALRTINQAKADLELKLRFQHEKYKEALHQCNGLRDRYIEQCRMRHVK